MTLLEQAKTFTKNLNKTTFSSEDLELASAWATGEITLSQVMRAKEFKNTAMAYSYLAQTLRAVFQKQQ